MTNTNTAAITDLEILDFKRDMFVDELNRRLEKLERDKKICDAFREIIESLDAEKQSIMANTGDTV